MQIVEKSNTFPLENKQSFHFLWKSANGTKFVNLWIWSGIKPNLCLTLQTWSPPSDKIDINFPPGIADPNMGCINYKCFAAGTDLTSVTTRPGINMCEHLS